VIYRELPLPDSLRGAFLCAWEFRLEPGDPPVVQHSIPPDGTSNLSVASAPDGTRHRRLAGPSLVSAAVPVVQGFRYTGLRVRPEAQRALFGHLPMPGSMTPCDGGGALAPLWRALETFDWSEASRSIGPATETDAAIGRAIDRMIASGGRCSVAALAAEAALSERQFRRRFRAATGIGAKQYADVQRTRRALILSLADADWAGIAAETGFADQPHLARDMRGRFGTPPARVAGYYGGMRHELLAPADVRKLQDPPARAA
jgi:AraC-like DNA-binding protein